MNQQAVKYVNGGYKKVDGFFSHMALKALVKMSEAQTQRGIGGAVCEIGVHHGRSFILLYMLTTGKEISVAYDLFEMQEENVDKSGEGDKEKFIYNLKKNNCDLSRIKIFSQNSMNLSAEKILEDAGSKVKLFSIDGGHTAEIVYNDLSVAAASLCSGGVIVIDDVFDEGWPGVSEGTCKFLAANKQLLPFAVFDDKAAFTNTEEMHDIYFNKLKQLTPEFLMKESEYFGKKVIVLYESPHKGLVNQLRRTQLWQSIKNNPHGNSIRRLLK